MGYDVNEWVFHVMDTTQTTGGSPPIVDDDAGVLYAVTPESADSPAVFTDKNGTALTEINGVAHLVFSNGEVKFYTDASITSLDIYWLSSHGCGILRAVAPNTIHFLKVGGAGPMVTGIPTQGLLAAEILLSVVPASGVTLTRCWGVTMTIGAGTTDQIDFGIVASNTGGDPNGFLADVTVSSLGVTASQPAGVLSLFKFNGSTHDLSLTPSAAHSAGVVLMMELVFPSRF